MLIVESRYTIEKNRKDRVTTFRQRLNPGT